MEDFVKRIIDEKKELEVKIKKLETFFITQTFGDLFVEEQDLLILQFHIMKSYFMVLQQRIDYYNN